MGGRIAPHQAMGYLGGDGRVVDCAVLGHGRFVVRYVFWMKRGWGKREGSVRASEVGIVRRVIGFGERVRSHSTPRGHRMGILHYLAKTRPVLVSITFEQSMLITIH